MLSAFLSLFVTICIFLLATKLYQKWSYPLLNPFLITILILIPSLLILNIPYQTYNQGGQWLTKLLDFAVVAFGLPLYLQLKNIRRDFLALLIVILLSALLGISSSIALAVLLGMNEVLIFSLATHSVTTPIAIAVSTSIGGNGALAAMGVLISGLIGALFAVPLLKLFGIKNVKAQGIAIGTSSHALGTSTIMKQGELQAAYSPLALVLCAIFTALLTPFVAPWLLAILS